MKNEYWTGWPYASRLYHYDYMKKPKISPQRQLCLAKEAKALVVMAFRNGPIEDVHAGKSCPTCDGNREYSHITQSEMREIMKTAVDRMYTFLTMKDLDPKAYEALVKVGEMYTSSWDEPTITTQF